MTHDYLTGRDVVHNVWGSENVSLYAMPNGTGAGPAVWCHALLPDYHAFRGNYGGYAFPLYDRRLNINASNLSAALVESLSVAYGQPVAPEGVFDAMLCLLSASSYTRRFAEDLEDVFPHVPFPARHAVLEDAVQIGREIRAVETSRASRARLIAGPALPECLTNRGVLSRRSTIPTAALRCAPTGLAASPESRWRSGAFRSAAIALCRVGSSRVSACRPI